MGDDARASLCGDLGERLAPLGIADHDFGARVGEEIADLMRRIGGVERQKDGAGPNAGEIDKDIRGRFLHLHGDAIARLNAEGGQGMGVTRTGREHLAVGEREAVRRLDKNFLGIGDPGNDQIEQVI